MTVFTCKIESAVPADSPETAVQQFLHRLAMEHGWRVVVEDADTGQKFEGWAYADGVDVAELEEGDES